MHQLLQQIFSGLAAGAVYASLGAFEQREAHERAERLLAGLGRPAEAVAAHVLHRPPSGDPG